MSRKLEREVGVSAATEKKLAELYDLTEGIEIAMMTTRRTDGSLVSRPMATQRHTSLADFWFVTDIETNKLDELRLDPNVNLAFYRDRTREWVSVSGTATISRDRSMIHELYAADWRIWFPDEGGDRDAGPDDPRFALILVEALSVTYMKQDKSTPRVLFEVARAMVTGKAADVGEVRELGSSELGR